MGFAQQSRIVSGTVKDEQNQPVIGVSVTLKGTTTGTQTNLDGKFSISVPENNQILVFNFVGMVKKEVSVAGKQNITVFMENDMAQLSEVVIVGYGVQKKASVVGAISQTTSKVLERTGGVSSLGAALTGNLPGVITTASNGLPGDEDPQILIRGRSTWNNASPLILVDGVERSINNIDISSVASVSVLKDASATAVFGVKGANGVILITTKRGKEGEAEVRASVNTVMKSVSKLPAKLDSYDMFELRNYVIENELALNPNSWTSYQPEAINLKYRYPANLTEAERYPNVDWVKTLFKDEAFSQNANLNVSGGTHFVKYFASVDYLNEGDVFKRFDNNRGYGGGYGFNRFNIRSNLDFQLTKSTVFRANVYGSRGVSDRPWISVDPFNTWSAAYSASPAIYLPRYSDGTWGYYNPDEFLGLNSAAILSTSGQQQVTTSRVTTDFILEQDLSSLAKGLNFKGTISLDNTFVEDQRGINDANNNAQRKWINPETGAAIYQQDKDVNTQFEYTESVRWSPSAGYVNDGATYRRMFSQLQLNYAKTIAAKHNLTAMGLWSRDEGAVGSIIPSYREDWVFRTTYNYAGKYTAEYNGAYNGSEKFGPNNRFHFFSSGGLGWVISEENFMKPIKFISNLKLRGSYGEIGDDSGAPRFAYLTNWSYGGQTPLGTSGEGAELSPYTWYREVSVGNPNVRWEKVAKKNIGLEFGFFQDAISGSIDVFQDDRSDILSSGDNRAVPSYFGAAAPVANLGKVQSKGFEIDVRVTKNVNNNLRLWANLNATHARNKVVSADVPALLPDYSKPNDKSIGQTYSFVSQGYYNNWDELYATTPFDKNDDQKLPGNYQILDFNSDGVIDQNDNIPYGFAGAPENTYSATLGFDWKRFSVFAQFYGVNNVTRQILLTSFSRQNPLAYEEGTYWSKDINSGVPIPRLGSTPADYQNGNRYMYDASYLRLKNAEIAYTFDQKWLKKAGMSKLRVFINGNNLYIWTKMPDDREINTDSAGGRSLASQGAYPTVKRFNLGANIIF